MKDEDNKILIFLIIIVIVGSIFYFYNANYKFKDFVASSIPFFSEDIDEEGYVTYDDFNIAFDTTDRSKVISIITLPLEFPLSPNCALVSCSSDIRLEEAGQDQFGCRRINCICEWSEGCPSLNDYYGGVLENYNIGSVTKTFNVDLTNDIKKGSKITKAYVRVDIYKDSYNKYTNFDFDCKLNGNKILGGNRKIIEMTDLLIDGTNTLTCDKPYEAWIFHDSNCIGMFQSLDASCTEAMPLPKYFMTNNIIGGCSDSYDLHVECATDKWLFKDGKFTFSDGMIIQGTGGSIKTIKNFDVRDKNFKIVGQTVANPTTPTGFALNFPGIGSWSLPGEYSSTFCHYDYSRSSWICEQPEIYFVKISHDPTDYTKTYIYVNGRLHQEFTHNPIYTYEPYMEIKGNFDYVRWKPILGCEVNANEVVVRDLFGGGSEYINFTKDDLSYIPTKYCPSDYPTIIRSYAEGGLVSDTRGTVTEKLATGQIITVPPFQTYEVQYMADYIINMIPRCDPFSEYYDTNKGGCVKQGFIFEPACFINSDCWLPSRCAGIVDVQCVDNQCIYSGECISPPPAPSGEKNLWDLIANAWVNFWNWVRSLFA